MLRPDLGSAVSFSLVKRKLEYALCIGCVTRAVSKLPACGIGDDCIRVRQDRFHGNARFIERRARCAARLRKAEQDMLRPDEAVPEPLGSRLRKLERIY